MSCQSASVPTDVSRRPTSLGADHPDPEFVETKTAAASTANPVNFMGNLDKRAFPGVAKQVRPRPRRLEVVATVDQAEIDPAVVVVVDGRAGGEADVAALVGR